MMNGKVIFVNSFMGLQYAVDIITRVAKQQGKENVYKQMLRELTSISEREIGKAKLIVAKYGKEVGVYLYDGDKPEPTNHTMQLTGLIAKGSFIMDWLKRQLDVDVQLDSGTIYKFDGQYVVPLS